ncbi:hypothetical protein LCGC14_1392480 [marine sediment metagenome]|uniref:ABC transporter substrate-binding protein n=3 Tax=root TaxID=1 RepID=A0A0F9JZH3_9ZZZZ
MLSLSFSRSLIISVFALLLVACGDGDSSKKASDISSQQTFHWKMVTTWPPGFPVLQDGAEHFAESVRAMSNGRLDIKVYAGGELIPALQTFNAVSQGTVEMGHGSAYYWAGKIPEAQFFSTVPFGMTAKGMNAWLYHGGGLELWRETYAPFNVIPFPMGNTGVQMGGWFNKQINSISDLQGLKMRIPGLGGKVFAKAGGNPVLLSGSEVYTALERNTIDATEWIGPYHDQRLGLYRAAEYYYYPGWHEPGTVFELSVNKQAWETLPADLQAIITYAAEAENMSLWSEMEQKNQQALQELKARDDVDLRPFPDDVIKTLSVMTKQTLEEEAAASPKFKKVYDAYQEFRKQDADWSAISERAYLNLETVSQ